MTDTIIKENYVPRRAGGALLLLVGLLLTAPALLVLLSGINRFGEAAMLLPGPFLTALGLWALFPRHPPKTRLRISDAAVTIATTNKTIALQDIMQIKYNMPALSKHYRLTFLTARQETPLDVIHLTHDGRDIINLIGIRLERQGKFLHQGRTAVAGALTGVWEVRSGTPFVTDPNHDKMSHDRE